jgi:hypothetical protein
MDKRVPPNFDVVLDMLVHTDSNYSFFAASKLKSIITALKIVKQTEYITDLITRLGEVR